MGVGMLSTGSDLDASAQAHALYLISNLRAGARSTAFTTTRSQGNANYYT